MSGIWSQSSWLNMIGNSKERVLICKIIVTMNSCARSMAPLVLKYTAYYPDQSATSWRPRHNTKIDNRWGSLWFYDCFNEDYHMENVIPNYVLYSEFNIYLISKANSASRYINYRSRGELETAMFACYLPSYEIMFCIFQLTSVDSNSPVLYTLLLCSS